MEMKKQILINLILLSSTLIINAQNGIWTPATNTLWTNANVGIGTTNPYSKLHVYSTASPTNYYDGELSIGGFLGTNNDMALVLGTHRNNSVSTLQSWKGGYGGYSLSLNPMGGNVGIGTTKPTYKLDVCGTIRAKEVIVDLTGTCPDFVFKSDYKLMDLKTLEEFVKTNQHLPEIAPEKEMVENGINVNELQLKLLQKIEELTLYTIEQNKKLEQQNQEILELKKQNERIKALEEKIEKIEAASK